MNDEIKVINAIVSFWETNGYAPSQKDIVHMSKLKRTTIRKILNILERERVILIDKGSGRTIRFPCQYTVISVGMIAHRGYQQWRKRNG